MIHYLRKWRRQMRHQAFRRKYVVGLYSYGTPTVHGWGEGTQLYVGKFCSIAMNVQIFLGGEHRTDWISTYPFSERFKNSSLVSGHPFSRGDVRIGNDVWIAEGVRIMSGVTIGDGAVIGAGAIVTHDVPPYAIAAGVPAKVVHFRFDDEYITKLLDLRWWDWPIEKILTHTEILMSHRFDELLSADNNLGDKHACQ